ncbi:MerR family transcriptional regulator [Chlorobium sp. BLA1]|uniref:Regulatory protein, MerR n=1 Tax=Chlorobium ferrooxidans DSM 13031 TaxID=377431 RepID=Q0YS63_9CHLB|nr:MULTISPECIES: MerR family transcriptional regulator [Chlorobium]EAT59127.1 regulatory protein, MerR [Chlorobium ferrooxidans DSM 13031]NHQ59012.1 MerR family transcriptional regulator [Candidatus Chlorobium masyuteum]NTU44378.1 MerR family transcriptional regulator [Chlorobiaceae bacterium]
MAFDSRKNYYSIGEVSKIAGIPSYLLRYWESFFTELAPARDTRGNRRYTNRDIAMVLNIKELVYEKGYRLGKASEIVKGVLKDSEGDHKTTEILKLQKQIGQEKKRNTVVDERRLSLMKEIKEEIEDILQLLG